jgi:hypothetical protein
VDKMELTEEDRLFLFEQRNSIHYRTFNKAISHLYMQECARLTSAKPEDLLRHQGILQGLALARNLLIHGREPEKEIKK